MTTPYAPLEMKRETLLNNGATILQRIHAGEGVELIEAGEPEHSAYTVMYNSNSSDTSVYFQDHRSRSVSMTLNKGSISGSLFAVDGSVVNHNQSDLNLVELDLRSRPDGSLCVAGVSRSHTRDFLTKDRFVKASPEEAIAFSTSLAKQVLSSPEIDSLRQAIAATDSVSPDLKTTTEKLATTLKSVRPCHER